MPLKTIVIEDRVHAEYSPSGLSRGIACNGSVLLKKVCKDETSFPAAEGTAAHWVAEMIQGKFFPDVQTLLEYQVKVDDFIIPVDEDMISAGLEYAAYIQKVKDNLTDEILLEGSELKLIINSRSYGYADYLIITLRAIHIIDLKYGLVRVYANRSTQLGGYLLGATNLEEIKPFDLELEDSFPIKFWGHIVQPRLNNFDKACFTNIDLLDLKEDIENLIKFGDDPSIAPLIFVSGDQQCQWCQGTTLCPQRYYQMLETYLRSGCKADTTVNKILAVANGKQIKSYIDKCQKELLIQAQTEKLDGLKLVRKTTNRKWIKDKINLNDYGITDDELYNKKIRSMTEIKKMIMGKPNIFQDPDHKLHIKEKWETIIDEYTTKAVGDLMLVPESDKKEEVIIENINTVSDFG